jgi:hypothetical protein
VQGFYDWRDHRVGLLEFLSRLKPARAGGLRATASQGNNKKNKMPGGWNGPIAGRCKIWVAER